MQNRTPQIPWFLSLARKKKKIALSKRDTISPVENQPFECESHAKCRDPIQVLSEGVAISLRF